jgi:hypothetical protein
VVSVTLRQLYPRGKSPRTHWKGQNFQILEKKWEYNETVYQLFIDFKKVRREVLCNILVECGVTVNLVGLIKMFLNETYIEVRIGKHLFDTFSIQNGLKQGEA